MFVLWIIDFSLYLYYYKLGIRLVGVKMLVSSIGYFDVAKVSSTENSIKNQVSKTNLTEGFGHFNEKQNNSKNDFNLLKSFIKSFKSLFSKEKSQDSSKCLSLVA